MEGDMNDFLSKLSFISIHISLAFEEVDIVIQFSCRISRTASISSCQPTEFSEEALNDYKLQWRQVQLGSGSETIVFFKGFKLFNIKQLTLIFYIW